MSEAEVFDARPCALGEGPIWHPARGCLLWFDILGERLLASRGAGEPGGAQAREWPMGEMASAAGLTRDPARLLIATETALILYHLETGAHEPVCALEADDPATRSNDGRADPWGGFWVSTMGKGGEEGAGALYRWHGGELRRLRDAMSVPNAICFDRARGRAYVADTPTQMIHALPLHPDTGWLDGEGEVFLDLRGTDHKPDGAVTDAEGNLWNAQWGSGRVACHDPEGRFLRAVAFPAENTSCPAFGGPDLTTLHCTSAIDGLDGDRARDPAQGRTYAVAGAGRGQPEPEVSL